MVYKSGATLNIDWNQLHKFCKKILFPAPTYNYRILVNKELFYSQTIAANYPSKVVSCHKIRFLMELERLYNAAVTFSHPQLFTRISSALGMSCNINMHKHTQFRNRHSLTLLTHESNSGPLALEVHVLTTRPHPSSSVLV